MRRLDWYIVKEVLYPMVFALAAFTTIIMGSSSLYPMILKSLKYGISFWDTLRLIGYKLPAILGTTLPMATLVGTVVGCGRLHVDKELLALRSVGVSIYRLLRPLFLVGIALSLLSFVISENIIPVANRNSSQLLASIKSSTLNIKENVSIRDFDEEGRPFRIVNVQTVDEDALKGITVVEYDEGNLARVIQADNGRWHASGLWEFNDGVMHQFFPDNIRQIMMMEFEQELINLHIDPFDPDQKSQSASQLNARDLKGKIQKNKAKNINTTKDEMKYYLKFALPFACFIFSLVGLTVEAGPQRGGNSLFLGISVMVIVLYYILYSIGMTLGILQILPPSLAAWLPNVLIGGVVFFILTRV